MEIVTYVREGAVTHQDSLGNRGRTVAGDVQVMSAGTGIRHAEYNLEDHTTRIFQIWIIPTERGGEPAWGSRPFPKDDRSGRFVALASGMGDADALPIRADARVLGATLGRAESATYTLGAGRFAYLVAATGAIEVNGVRAEARDGIAIRDEHELRITAIDGARAILIETIAEDAALVGELRDWLWNKGEVQAKVFDDKRAEGAKFADYFDHHEPIAQIPSHRLLALLRARNEGILALELLPLAKLQGSGDEARAEAVKAGHLEAEQRVALAAGIADRGRPADAWLRETVRQAWHYKLHLGLGLDLFLRAREAAEEEAIRVFGDNLKDLLLAAPAGARAVMGLDPGLRTGVKVAVVDATGKLVDTATIYPHAPRNDWDRSIAELARLARKHAVQLVAIGNGTASRETDRLAAELMKRHAELHLTRIVVSEAGASVYSASELAAREFPDLDVSLRGAVSIARRLQDPLAELVKIEPKAIGVGQYQHDVNQSRLARALDARVEDCVNAVGVEVNTASAALLARVAGLSSTVAENIVRFRDERGAFRSRRGLLEVPRLGEKTFEQCAGFLRIGDGDDPLDASSVHPEAYPVVERILARCGRPVRELIGDGAFLRGLDAGQFTDERFGLPTVRDILKELEKPGRDPRPEFKAAKFADGVEDLKDLVPGMVLEGVVSNVAAFGAFVDLGVHQDGLVHVSALSEKFVKDPREVVKAGDIVKVKVIDVDIPRKRIALSMRLDDPVGADAGRGRDGRGARDGAPRRDQPKPRRDAASSAPPPNNAFAEAFARARRG
uniref:Helix-hairpin-helix domain-containing protein n=1 Tax=Coralloluteibacterium stylophorae TaxID=1776034 RepID=A0A8J7VXT4_9GAMM